MHCPHCGAQAPPGSTSCPSCYAPLGGAARGGAVSKERPGALTLLAIVDILMAFGYALVGVGVGFLIFNTDPPTEVKIIVGIGVAFALGIALWFFSAGVGVFLLKGFGRILQLGLAGLMLLSVPFGTIAGVLLLIYLLKPGAKILFSNEEARTPQEMSDLAAVRASGGLVIGAVAVQVVSVFIAIGILGMMGAITIPALLGARAAAGEAASIGDIRTMISAQAAYQASNAGYYDSRLECLVKPAVGCIPNYPADGPWFMDKTMTQSPRRGYNWTFVPGAPPPQLDRTTMSPTSVTEFAYLATPVSSDTGRRIFCGDSSGIVCQWTDGVVPDVSSGRCPADCPVLY
jgi:type II secretory pathway pseudopilin PulG